MKKTVILLIIILTVSSIFTVEKKYEGVWFFYHEKTKSNSFLIINKIEETYFAVFTSEKRSINNMNIGKIIEEDLILSNNYTSNQTFKYDNIKDTLVRHSIANGLDTQTIYRRVDSKMKTELMNKYFKKK